VTTRRRSLLLGLASAAVGCSRPPAPAAPARPTSSLHLDPMTDLVAAGGLDSLVIVRWAEVVRALEAPLGLLLTPAGLDALGEYLGFEPRLIEELIVASYGATTLYLLRVPHDPQKVERLFLGRLTAEVLRSNDGPGVVRLNGRIGNVPRGLATLLPDTVAYEVGPSGPLKAVVAFAQGKLKKARPALLAEPLASLVHRLGDAPIRVFFPSPASWKGANGLLDRAVAAGVSLTPRGGNLALKAALLGAWDDPPAEALRRLERTVSDVAGSGLGHLTALDAPVEPLRLGGDAELITAETTLDATRLAKGLRDITRASLAELFPGLKKTSEP